MSGTDAAAAAAVAGCLAALPQDLLAEIFARVPLDVAFLFRCALVCKRWRRLLADPAFLCRLFPEAAGRSSSLLGFFVQRHRPGGAVAWTRIAGLFKNRAPAFVPAPGSALGPRRRFLTSFVRDAGGLLDKAEPLAERGGLVLLRVFPRGAARGNMFSLCVCSLLTGKLDVLPPLDTACFDGEGVRGYAVLPFASHGAAAQQPSDGYSNLCKVLLIGVHDGSKQLSIHSFSTAGTALQNWSTKSVSCLTGDEGSFSGPYGSSVAAVCCDTAHWLFQEDGPTGPILFTVGVSIDTGHVCSNRFVLDDPEESRAQLSLSIDARLSLLYHKHNRLVIRTLRDVAHGGKLLATMCVAEKSDTALVLFCSDPGRAYLLDLQSRLPTELAGWKRSFNYKTAVPYEIDWSELFMSRLGVQL
jgi:hypothetical protein